MIPAFLFIFAGMKYQIADNIIAFSTERDQELPFYVVQPHQVHGDIIKEVTNPFTTRDELEGVDALVTNVPGVAISVRTADCIPVLLYDPVNEAVAAVHDGWRGTVLLLQIAGNTDTLKFCAPCKV